MNLEKLKETARKFEQKEEWRKAIDVYLRAVHQVEDGVETAPDLSLYNRIGDLYLKIGDVVAAVRSYERAIDLYADQGFFNNAIALCGKVLRVNPARTQTYLKLAQLHARKNVVIEAKRNLIEFLERMNAVGQIEQAFESVNLFADQFAGSQEIRMMMVELLRASSREEEAREQLEKLAVEQDAAGDAAAARRTRERLHTSDDVGPDGSDSGDAAFPDDHQPRAGELIFLDTGPSSRMGSSVAPADGLIPTAEPAGEVEAPADMPVSGLEMTTPLDPDADTEDTGEVLRVDPDPEPLAIERTEPAVLDFDGGRLDGLEGTPLELPDEADDELEMVVADVEPALEPTDLTVDLDVEPLDLELSGDEAISSDELPEILEPEEPPVGTGLTSLEDRVLDDPDNPDLHRDLADALFTADQPERALDELELALSGYEAMEHWEGASGIVDRFLSVYPDSIRLHQKRVELAYRAGERTPLITAYLGLGDALARGKATEKAVAVFRRVQEHDPGNVRAATALAVLVQPPVEEVLPSPEPPGSEPTSPGSPSQAAGDSFVDLGAMVLDPQRAPNSRMHVDRSEPTGDDEQREFHEILEQFKRGIEDNLGAEDYDAHYDLGVAFKEMGLLDDAIAEFQKSVRTPSAEGRLRTSEALGAAFCEQAQYAVAEVTLRRALEGAGGGDEAKIGLIYWLSRALEAQGKVGEAIAGYERALAVDIRFLDLSERISRLTADRRP